MEAKRVITDSVKKPIPNTKDCNCQPLSFDYQSSPGGIDSNLLILLHGLGDSNQPFLSLGKKLQGDLPQTAILSLCGGCAIPFMEHSSWGFWDVWDGLGQEIVNPNPTVFLNAFQSLIDYLIRPVEQNGCGWPPDSIHLFGFAHGATAALEGVIAFTRRQKSQKAKGEERPDETKTPSRSYPIELGSIVSIYGDFLSHPTFTPPLNIPILAITINQTESLIKKAFKNGKVVTFSSISSQPRMPQNEQEWRTIMIFWSRVLRNRAKWELDGNLYTISPHPVSQG